MGRRIIYIKLLIVLHIFNSCTEEYLPSNESYEDLLVVETTITDQLKHQEIKLSRTSIINDHSFNAVDDAQVSIIDEQNNIYEFAYSSQDTAYLSIQEFKIEPNINYKLQIEEANGEKYESSNENLPQQNNNLSLEMLKGEYENDYGVKFLANTNLNNTNPLFVRYTYEEAYKVISPYWGPYKAMLFFDPPPYNEEHFYIYYTEREEQNQICYTVKQSNEILLTNTIGSSENRIDNHLVRFISEDNWRIAHRYSIKVTQYIESEEAYRYYYNLRKNAGNNGNTLSPNQPGFIQGNIQNINNPNERVVGYFDIASESEQRVFFNYDELFNGNPKPDFFIDCSIQMLDRRGLTARQVPQQASSLLNYVTNEDRYLYKIDENNDYIYWMVQTPCSKCTDFSSNEIPEFWYE